MEFDAILDDMPDAPAQPPRRGIGSEMNVENIVRRGVAFALFVVSILLVVWAVGLLEKGLLDPYPPELAQRHQEFKQLKLPGLEVDFGSIPRYPPRQEVHFQIANGKQGFGGCIRFACPACQCFEPGQ